MTLPGRHPFHPHIKFLLKEPEDKISGEFKNTSISNGEMVNYVCFQLTKGG